MNNKGSHLYRQTSSIFFHALAAEVTPTTVSAMLNYYNNASKNELTRKSNHKTATTQKRSMVSLPTQGVNQSMPKPFDINK